MAGDWIPIRDDLSSVREVVAIAKRTGWKRREVVGALVQFWGWAQRETSDGKIVDADVDALVDLFAIPKNFWLALIAAGWLIEGVDGKEGVTIPNFNTWLSESAKSRLQKNKRQKKWRSRVANVDADVDANVGGSHLPHNSTEQNIIEEERNRAGAPTSPSKRHKKPRAPNYSPDFIGTEPVTGDGLLPPALQDLFRRQGKSEAYTNVFLTEKAHEELIKQFGAQKVHWAGHALSAWSKSLEVSKKTNMAGWQSYRLKRDHAACIRNQILKQWPELRGGYGG